MVPGIGAGSNYLGYLPPLEASAKPTPPGIGAGSNYLGYAPPSVLEGSKEGAKSGFALLDAFEEMMKKETPGENGMIETKNSSSGVASSSLPPSVVDYLNADLAKYYGMSKETAYQEALSNTAYQRAVRDMQSAGLNPAVLFGAGKGYTASGVPYAQSASSGSGGSGSGGSGSGKLFSSGVYNAIATAAGIGGSIVAKGPAKVSAYWVSSNAAKGIMSALDALF